MPAKTSKKRVSDKTALILDALLLTPTFFLYAFLILVSLGFAADRGPDSYASGLKAIVPVLIGIGLVWLVPFIGSVALYNTRRYGWSILAAAMPIIAFAGLIISAIVANEWRLV